MFKLTRQFDEPMIDSSMIPTFLVSKLVREHCTVAIGGDGGDELFGGYKHYDRLLRSKEFFSGVPLPIKKIASQISGNILPIGFKGRIGLQNMIADLNTELPTVSSYFDKNYRKRLIDYHQKEWLLMAEEIRRNRTPANSNLLQRITRMDFENYLPEDVLVKVDRASMLNSLEVRAPLLDYRIIEFAFRKVPANLKATTNSRKIILKKLAEKILPDNFDYTRKQGFGIPLANWLRSGPWLDFFKIILLSSEQQLFNHKVVANMIKMHQNGISNNSERLFGLVLFELWRREYDISI
ncbi:MAG: asparagine synthase C-terminal domain-containing protein [Melioribacteraceae bacterium]|jgi:asparagine synthase (glutamine-hydrolysing)|nr:asparagine synthase C-terminal domain-containing protein [Melioribacteraceae bacterium]